METRSDEELMAAYQGGDRGAFRLLFDRWAPRLRQQLRRAVREEAAVDDLVQQTFLQLHRARRDFEPGRKLAPWLRMIATNLGRQHFRTQGRRAQPSPGEDARELAERQPDAGASPERGLEAGRIQAAVASLPAKQREAIALHWFEGLSFAEVAHRSGASESAVKVRAHRGYQRLRTLFGGGRGGAEVTALPGVG